MSRIINVALMLMLCACAYGQVSDAQVKTASSDETKKCVPTKACAEKAGMTLEQCKAVCAKKNAKSASLAGTTDVPLLADQAKAKSCQEIDYVACAKKMGMTVEECKALCKSREGKTKVASAMVEVNAEKEKVSKTICAKSKAACCSKAKKVNQ